MVHDTEAKVSALIEPMRKVKYRNQIMPAECSSPDAINFYLSPPKINENNLTEIELVPSNRNIHREESIHQKEIIERDIKI